MHRVQLILWICGVLSLQICSVKSAPGIGSDFPSTLELYEDTDTAETLFTFSATCTESYSYGYSCGVFGWSTCYATSTRDKTCDRCFVNSGDTNVFSAGAKYVAKQACSTPGCTSCSSANGCLNFGEVYEVEVGCYYSGYSGARVYKTVAITITENTAPTITSAASIYLTTEATNTIIYTLTYSDNESGDTKTFLVQSQPENGYLRGYRLFSQSGTSNQLKTIVNLADEFSKLFSMQFCVKDRRNTACIDIAIEVESCFETPTCEPLVVDTLTDEHPAGGAVTPMLFALPSDHFHTWSTQWQGLTWQISDNGGLDMIVIDSASGTISTNGPITVYPNYPSISATLVVRVSNSESCATSTCSVTVTVTYTTYDIAITNVPITLTIHEDADGRLDVHSIGLADNSDPAQDSATCTLPNNPYPDFFSLDNGISNTLTEWKLVKNSCSSAGCGLVTPCPTNSGCLDYRVTTSYQFDLRCCDAYVSCDTETFTVNVQPNAPPTFDNIPGTVEVDGTVTEGTVVFTTATSDAENDILTLSLTDGPETAYLRDYTLFRFEGGSIIATRDLAMEYSSIYHMTICMVDRRNQDICGVVTLQLTSCFQTPVCGNLTNHALTDQHPIGDTVLQMTYADPTSPFTAWSTGWPGLSWSIADNGGLDMLAIREGTGEMYTTGELVVYPHYPYRNALVTVEIANINSCHASQCVMDLQIEFINFDLTLDLSEAIEIAENADDAVGLLALPLSDPNNPDYDNVTCVNLVNPDDSIFVFQDNGQYATNSFYLGKLECQQRGCGVVCDDGFGCLSYDQTPSYELTFRCCDGYQSCVTDTLTVNVLDNQAPAFTNIADTVYIDGTVTVGDVVTTIGYTDEENDDVTFSLTSGPEDAYQGDHKLFQLDGADVIATANLADEFSFVYHMSICIEDRRNKGICGELTINLTSCFQTPTCQNIINDTITDQHPVGVALQDMLYGMPTDQFSAWSTDWPGLDWSIVDNGGLDNLAIDALSGTLSITDRLVVYPHYPYLYTNVIVQMANINSCQPSQCTIQFRIEFINFPLTITNKGASVLVKENADAGIPLVQVGLADGNDPDHDHATCQITYNPDPFLLNLTSDGLFALDSNTLFKQPCLETWCGPVCQDDIGCLSFDQRSSYTIEYQCCDGYQSCDNGNFTLEVEDNEAPVFDNLPYTVYIDGSVKAGDVIFAISYTDTEGDNVTYTMSNGPENAYLRSYTLFEFNDGNVTASRDLDAEFSYLFNMTLDMRDRRNHVSGLLTINLTSCYQTPRCSDRGVHTIADTFPVGQPLFTVSHDPPAGHFLDWSDDWQALDLTVVDSGGLEHGALNISNAGELMISERIALPVAYGEFNVTVGIGNSESCNVTTCVVGLAVETTNWNISIESPTLTTTISEDGDDWAQVFHLLSADGNHPDYDNVTCNITSNPDWSLWELYHDGNYADDSWWISKQACQQRGCRFCPEGIGCLNYDNRTVYVIEAECCDAFGSCDIKNYTANVVENQPPIFVDWPETLMLNGSVKTGDPVFTILYDDPEGEVVTFDLQKPPGLAYLRNYSLFRLSNGSIEATVDFDREFSYNFSMEIRMADRRNDVYRYLYINLTSCFDVPVCYNQSGLSVIDDFVVGGELVAVNYSSPANHFTEWSNDWQNLRMRIADHDGLPGINISNTGSLVTTDHIVVPNPHRDFVLAVEISNDDSCEVTYCYMGLRVNFTNSAVQIVNMPASGSLWEDKDERWPLLNIELSDGDYPYDNFTYRFLHNPDEDLFEISDDGENTEQSFTVYKKQCDWLDCGSVCTNVGCLNYAYNTSYLLSIEVCDFFGSCANGTYNLTVVQNQPPGIVNLPADVAINGSVGSMETIFSVETSNLENETLSFHIESGPEDAYARNYKLFGVNNETGHVYAIRPLATEFSSFFNMTICVSDRRTPSADCQVLTINLTSCFAVPVCYNQTGLSVTDEFGVGGELFRVNFSNPSTHFLSWSNGWQGLHMRIVDTAGFPLVNVSDTGSFTTTDNLVVPYPHRDFSLTVEISNDESCEVTTCSMELRVNFTNSPIEITSLPASDALFEDRDERLCLHSLGLADGDYPYDNAACLILNNPDEDLFELYVDGSTKKICKKRCDWLDCGSVCYNPGCLNHRLNSSYEFTMECCDDYGSCDNGTYNLTVVKNEPPAITNLPAEVAVDSSQGVGLVIFSTNTHNVENETLSFHIESGPEDAYGRTYKLFGLNNETGEISIVRPLATEFSSFFTMIICVSDRRTPSADCQVLTINLTSCYDVPRCVGQTNYSFSNLHEIGDVLFQVAYDVEPEENFHLWSQTWPRISYNITDTDGLDVLSIDDTGYMTISDYMAIPYPYGEYNVTVEISNDGSCSSSFCYMVMRVYFTNRPLTIDPVLPVAYGEDTDEGFIVLNITVSDLDGQYDNVTCNFTSNQNDTVLDIFEMLDDNQHNSHSYQIFKKECQYQHPVSTGACMDYDQATEYNIPFQCCDGFDSCDNATFHLDVIENLAPYLQNIPSELFLDDSSVTGDTVFTIEHNNTEEEAVWFYIEAGLENGFRRDYPLFVLDIETGQLNVTHDLSTEFSSTFELRACAADRRNANCGNHTINITSCYDVPTCVSQTNYSFSNLHGIGDRLFQVAYELEPDDHFHAWSPGWPGIRYNLTDKDGLGVLFIDDTGYMTISDYMAVPHPYGEYNVTVEISNDGSCVSTVCHMMMRVQFTNRPLTIDPVLPVAYGEDTDEGIIVLNITVSDLDGQYDNVTCNFTSNQNDTVLDIFEMLDDNQHNQHSYQIFKKECQYQHPDSTGACMDYDQATEYNIPIQCCDGFDSCDNATFHLDVIENLPPYLQNVPSALFLDDSSVTGDTVFTIEHNNTEEEAVWFYIEAGLENGFRRDYPLFVLDNETGQLNVTHDLSTEFSSTFELNTCVEDRRNVNCGNITINITSCYDDAPMCLDQSNHTFTNLHAVGDPLFMMAYNGTPDAHFFPWNESWPGIRYAIADNDGLNAVTVDDSGKMTISETMAVPYPAGQYEVVVEISNEGSCVVKNCSMNMTVDWNNWVNVVKDGEPITIPSLTEQSVREIDENFDDAVRHPILTQDANGEFDNVTCIFIYNPDDTLFYLDDDGNHSKNSYGFSKRECGDPGCGPVCPTGIGCMNFDNRSVYKFELECCDGFGSCASGNFTFLVTKNTAPAFVGVTDMKFESDELRNNQDLVLLNYTDAEGDPLSFNYTFPANVTFFQGDATGNNQDNIATISLTSYNWELVNDTFSVTISATDRRNTITTTIDIEIRPNRTAPEITFPDNQGNTIQVPETKAAGSLIIQPEIVDPDTNQTHVVSITVLPPEYAYLFQVNESDGSLSLASDQQFNYENRTSFTISFDVADQHLQALAPTTLTIVVQDVNEPPVLSVVSPISFEEGQGPFQFGEVGSCYDDDPSNSIMTITISGGDFADNFTLSMNGSVGLLTVDVDWDLETDMPPSIALELTCVTDGGLSDTAFLNISITEKNEFTPVATATNSEFKVTSTTPFTDVLTQITATDDDYFDDGNFVFSVRSTSTGAQYFAVSNTGAVSLSTKITETVDQTYTLTIDVSDGEASPLTTNISVTAKFEYTPDSVSDCPSCGGSNTGAIVGAVVSVLCLLAAAGVVSYFMYAKRLFCCRFLRPPGGLNGPRNTHWNSSVAPSQPTAPNPSNGVVSNGVQNGHVPSDTQPPESPPNANPSPQPSLPNSPQPDPQPSANPSPAPSVNPEPSPQSPPPEPTPQSPPPEPTPQSPPPEPSSQPPPQTPGSQPAQQAPPENLDSTFVEIDI